MKNLIIPVAGQSSRYPGMRPKWLLTMPDGSLMIEKSISLIKLDKFNKILIIALRHHVEKYSSEKILTKILKKNISKKIRLILLDKPTTCQAETVLNGIQIGNLKGGILIKDSDNLFNLNITSSNLNRISVINTKKIDLIDAKNKSYISIDKFGKVTNIIEKKVISNLFCCGAYEFKSSKEFVKYAKYCLQLSKNVYISDVIYSMILDHHSFFYTEAFDYIDWGTLREFRNYKKKFFTIFCDFDGCLIKNSSKFSKKPWEIKPIKENINCLKNLQKKLNIELIITTSRPNSDKINIIKFLKAHNIKFKNIITDLMHSKRILVNDFAESNPYPSSIAVNIPRDFIGLSNILYSITQN
jgi:hypothetical protein